MHLHSFSIYIIPCHLIVFEKLGWQHFQPEHAILLDKHETFYILCTCCVCRISFEIVHILFSWLIANEILSKFVFQVSTLNSFKCIHHISRGYKQQETICINNLKFKSEIFQKNLRKGAQV